MQNKLATPQENQTNRKLSMQTISECHIVLFGKPEATSTFSERVFFKKMTIRKPFSLTFYFILILRETKHIQTERMGIEPPKDNKSISINSKYF